MSVNVVNFVRGNTDLVLDVRKCDGTMTHVRKSTVTCSVSVQLYLIITTMKFLQLTLAKSQFSPASLSCRVVVPDPAILSVLDHLVIIHMYVKKTHQFPVVLMAFAGARIDRGVISAAVH